MQVLQAVLPWIGSCRQIWGFLFGIWILLRTTMPWKLQGIRTWVLDRVSCLFVAEKSSSAWYSRRFRGSWEGKNIHFFRIFQRWGRETKWSWSLRGIRRSDSHKMQQQRCCWRENPYRWRVARYTFPSQEAFHRLSPWFLENSYRLRGRPNLSASDESRIWVRRKMRKWRRYRQILRWGVWAVWCREDFLKRGYVAEMICMLRGYLCRFVSTRKNREQSRFTTIGEGPRAYRYG